MKNNRNNNGLDSFCSFHYNFLTMFGNFLMKKLLASKMKDVPKEQQEMVFAMLEKNPDLFKNIAEESQELIKQGKSQMDAVMQVMKKYENELKALKQ